MKFSRWKCYHDEITTMYLARWIYHDEITTRWNYHTMKSPVISKIDAFDAKLDFYRLCMKNFCRTLQDFLQEILKIGSFGARLCPSLQEKLPAEHCRKFMLIFFAGNLKNLFIWCMTRFWPSLKENNYDVRLICWNKINGLTLGFGQNENVRSTLGKGRYQHVKIRLEQRRPFNVEVSSPYDGGIRSILWRWVYVEIKLVCWRWD